MAKLGTWKNEQLYAAPFLHGGKDSKEGGKIMNASARTTRNSKTGKDTKAETSPVLGSAGLPGRRQLEKMVAWTAPERLRCLWYRLRLTIAEMNYATPRMAEPQLRLP